MGAVCSAAGRGSHLPTGELPFRKARPHGGWRGTGRDGGGGAAARVSRVGTERHGRVVLLSKQTLTGKENPNKQTLFFKGWFLRSNTA